MLTPQDSVKAFENILVGWELHKTIKWVKPHFLKIYSYHMYKSITSTQ